MDSLHAAIPKGFRLASVPLIIAYGVVPLSTAAVRATGDEFHSISIMLPWLLLAAFGTLLAMNGDRGRIEWKRLSYLGLLFLLLVAGLILYARDILAELTPLLPALKELSPLVFLLFSLLWMATCGIPDRADFQRFGALLGTICLVDFGVEVVSHGALPTVRWIGNVDVLAGLLLVSLCASLKPGGNEGGRYEPDQGHPLWRLLIKLAILSCLSRTGLFAAAWVVLCFGRGSGMWRFAYAMACAGLLCLTFFLPSTPSDTIRYADYWLWVEGLRLFSENPKLFLTGFPLAASLPVHFPPTMAMVWQTATGESHLSGTFLHQIPSFWLRLIMGWGIFAPLGLFGVLFGMLMKRLTRMGAGLIAALFAQGMSAPLLYDPALAVSICLGFILALSAPLHPHDENPEPVREREPVLDPKEEWDLQTK